MVNFVVSLRQNCRDVVVGIRRFETIAVIHPLLIILCRTKVVDVAVAEAEPSDKVCETEDAPASFKSVWEHFHSVKTRERRKGD